MTENKIIPERKFNRFEEDINNYLVFIIPNVAFKKIRSKGKLNFEYFCICNQNDLMTLVFASNNEHKIKEINSLLGASFKLLSLNDINIREDIPENESRIEGNALAKARFVSQASGMDVFADDTGLEIATLNGLPGVHSARFAGENKDSSANIEKVLSMLGNSENREARFRTVIALILGKKEFLFEGIVNGTIISKKKGNNGFGYDPIFIPEGKIRTFAEMELEEKNSVSHRARAFEKLKEFLILNTGMNNK